MKNFDQVKEEVIAEWREKSRKFTANQLDAEVYRRFHLQRVLAEVETYRRAGKEYRIVFVATPGNEWCGSCWQRNSKSVSLEEIKSGERYHVCSCTIVVPAEEEQE